MARDPILIVACQSGGATGLMVITAVLASTLSSSAAELKPEMLAAFDKYIRLKEARLEQPPAARRFLWADATPDRNRQLREGAVLAQPASDQREVKVPDGLIHDWVGAVFIPGTTVERTIALVQDYRNHRNVYQPEVIDSKILAHSGDDFKVYLRLKKKKVLTVVLNTEHEVHYVQLDRDRWQSRSYSTHIGEVENAGKPDERELPAGKDHGFLWRLYSYWRFEERDGGVYVECEAVSLTRNVPAGLGWLIEPIIRKLPRESLVNTLLAMRAFLAPNHAAGGPSGARAAGTTPAHGSGILLPAFADHSARIKRARALRLWLRHEHSVLAVADRGPYTRQSNEPPAMGKTN